MKAEEETKLCERIAAYLAGECPPDEARELSERIGSDPEARDLMIEILDQAVAVRDLSQAEPQVALMPTPRRRAWLAPAFALAACVALAVAWWTGVRRDSAMLAAHDVSGTVRWVGANGESVPFLSDDARVGSGTIETLSDDAAVTLSFRDGTRVTLTAHSAATLSDSGQKRVDLRQGNLSADVRPQPTGRPLVIQTPTALLEVLGTRFDVEAGSSMTWLDVEKGLVQVTRLVDGRTAKVPAEREILASADGSERFEPRPHLVPIDAWESDLRRRSGSVRGEWRTGDEAGPPFVRAVPKLVWARSKPQTIYGAGFDIPNPKRLEITPGSRLRVRGRVETLRPVTVMLSTRRPQGGFAGNRFAVLTPEAREWEFDVPAADFRPPSWEGTEADFERLLLRHIFIYQRGGAAGLEIEHVEVVPGS